ncbi:NAD dependent epimerase/dehydratase family [Phytophthora infestans]|uniref:NAD dependent epimerase/dehydratase family n=1 Tax=Phytophthora infestans TaxID=4787 RepID=A0A833SLD9_PHYIN|nr:NAD dependent epimerase/dehydratase family [Phytophthora infestans]
MDDDSRRRVMLVTGGTGLVGRALQDIVATQGSSRDEWHFVGSKDADLRDPQQTRKLFERVQPTHVLHLAALVGGLFHNLSRKVDFFRENMAINDSVLQCCQQFHVEKLVRDFVSAGRDDATQRSSAQLNEGYAMAKRLIDTLNRCYADQFGCNFTSVIPTNIYGPHDNFNIDNGHVVPGLIHKCYLAKRDLTPFAIWGSGKPLRQFIYSLDVARLMLWTLDHYNSVEPLILSVGEEDEVSIGNVAQEIAAAMDFRGNYVRL